MANPLPFSPPSPQPHCKDLASIVLEFQYCSENEKPLNAIRGWGSKEHLTPLGQLKIPFILAESSVIDPASQRPEFLFLEGAGGLRGVEGGFQLKANSLLCLRSVGRCSCLSDLTVCGHKSCEIRVICVPFPEKKKRKRKNCFFINRRKFSGRHTLSKVKVKSVLPLGRQGRAGDPERGE